MQQLLNAPKPKAPKEVPYYCRDTYKMLNDMVDELDIAYVGDHGEDVIRRYAIKMTAQPGVIPTPYSAYDLMLKRPDELKDFSGIKAKAIKAAVIIGAIITAVSLIRLFTI